MFGEARSSGVSSGRAIKFTKSLVLTICSSTSIVRILYPSVLDPHLKTVSFSYEGKVALSLVLRSLSSTLLKLSESPHIQLAASSS